MLYRLDDLLGTGIAWGNCDREYTVLSYIMMDGEFFIITDQYILRFIFWNLKYDKVIAVGLSKYKKFDRYIPQQPKISMIHKEFDLNTIPLHTIPNGATITIAGLLVMDYDGYVRFS